MASVVGRCGSCDSVGREVGCEVGRDASEDVWSVGRCDVGRVCSSCCVVGRAVSLEVGCSLSEGCLELCGIG